jgi:inward rectifier potassium channel
MRNRWFHAPRFHTARDGEKAVSWLELFYDLVFVAAIIQLGNILSDQVAAQGTVGGPMVLFASLFIPLWVAWTGYSFFANRFTLDDTPHRLLVFLKMFAMGAMAISATDVVVHGDHRLFAMSFCLVQGIVALMYLRAWKQADEGRRYARYWGLVFFIGALLWFVSIWVPPPWAYVMWGLGVATVLLAPVSKQSRQLAEQFPLDMEHLGERYGLLTIIVLGESFVKVLSYLATPDTLVSAPYLFKAAASLFITCSIWWIYFDDVAGAHLKKGRANWIVWFFGHLPLALAVTAVGVAVKKFVTFDFAHPPVGAYQTFLAVSIALVFFSVAIIDSVTERRDAQLSDGARVNMRFGSAVLILVLGLILGVMTAGLFIAIITVVCLGQIVFDIMMQPHTGVDEAFEQAIPVAQRARQIGGDDTRRRRRRFNPAEVLRRGTPSELKRDLYFFFMEGSWSRLLFSLGFVFLLLNTFFAGLYLLDPAAIAGQEQTFASAFSFSVQTLSTIGYGVLNPATPYANIIVGVQAAVGIFFYALVTGLLFAKASRPQASVLFSRPMILARRNGKPTLMFRVGNARGNEVVEATINVSVLREEISREGQHLRKMYDLELERSRSPFFSLSWLVMHEIDQDSPLADIDFSQADDDIALFAVTLEGHDATYGQTTFASYNYVPGDIRVGHRFVDVISEAEDGRLLIDFTRFHDTEPNKAPPLVSADGTVPVDDHA